MYINRVRSLLGHTVSKLRRNKLLTSQVLSPKKCMVFPCDASTNRRQYVLSQPIGNTSKLICPPIEYFKPESGNRFSKAATKSFLMLCS